METPRDQRAGARHGAQRRHHPSKNCGGAGTPARSRAEPRGVRDAPHRSSAPCETAGPGGGGSGAGEHPAPEHPASHRSPPRRAARSSAASGAAPAFPRSRPALPLVVRSGAERGQPRTAQRRAGGGCGRAAVAGGARVFRGVYFSVWGWPWVCVPRPALGVCARGVRGCVGAAEVAGEAGAGWSGAALSRSGGRGGLPGAVPGCPRGVRVTPGAGTPVGCACVCAELCAYDGLCVRVSVSAGSVCACERVSELCLCVSAGSECVSWL